MTEQRKIVTVLFADIVGSTALASDNDPEVVRRLLGRYFERMSRIAEAHGGTVEKFIGDAVMVVFGVPVTHEDDAERAVRAALAMRHATGEIEREIGIGFSTRVGVNTGAVVAGETDRKEFLVTGDAVNVAARLQQSAQPDEVLVGPSTQRLTASAIEYTASAPMRLKGKAESVQVFRALSARESLPLRQRPTAYRGPLLGRERELELMLLLLQRTVVERRPLTLRVVGRAGIGKSRLVEEALSRFASIHSTRTLRGHCLPYGDGITYWPLIEIVRDDARISPTHDRATARAQLEARIAEVSKNREDLSDVASRLRLLLGLQNLSESARPIAAGDLAREFVTGLCGFVEAVARLTPLVVVIDDLQWAEQPLLDAIDDLASRLQRAPVLLVCIAREEILESRPEWLEEEQGGTHLRLGPLDTDDTAQLVAQLLAESDLSASQRKRIVERSGGNPLFCEEFVRLFLDAPSGSISDRIAGEHDLPDTIQAVLAASLDALPAQEKRALQVASVIGEFFTLPQLFALVSRDEVGTGPDSLLKKGFLRDHRFDAGTQGLRFKHELMLEVAYGSLPKMVRLTLHSTRGQVLERAVGDRAAEFAEIIAYHARRTFALAVELLMDTATIDSARRRAIDWSRNAAARALALSAMAKAAAHYRDAISIAQTGTWDGPTLTELYKRRGSALEADGSLDEAMSNYVEMDEIAAEHGDPSMRAAAAHQRSALVARLKSVRSTNDGPSDGAAAT